MIPRTLHCNEEEWGQRWQGVEHARARAREETDRAMEQLRKMILDVKEGGEMELPG